MAVAVHLAVVLVLLSTGMYVYVYQQSIILMLTAAMLYCILVSAQQLHRCLRSGTAHPI
jgi:hypothetical protein